MYNYKIDDEVSEKVASSYKSNTENKKLNDLIDQISSIDSNYHNISIPDYEEPSYEKLENIDINNDEIRKSAEDSLSAYKNENISKINNDYNEDKISLEDKKIDVQNSYNEDKLQVANYFDNAKESAKNSALSRGIARSSILINSIDAFNDSEIAEYNRLDNELTESINIIDFKLNSLNQQKEEALNNFDIAYAVKLNDKINSLTSDLQKKQNEIIKYNNQIEEKEKKFKLDYEKFVADLKDNNADNSNKLVELSAKYGYKVVDTYRKNQIFDTLDSYFNGMDREEIIETLNTNNELKSVLGALWSEAVERYKK